VRRFPFQLFFLFLVLFFPVGVTGGNVPGNRVPGEWLIHFHPDMDEMVRDNLHRQLGTRLLSRFNGSGIDLVETDPAMGEPEVITGYSARPEVLELEPNVFLPLDGAPIPIVPSDFYFGEQWSFWNTGQTGGTEGADLGMPLAWKRTVGSHDVVVAVIDSGVDYTHPDLTDNLWVNEWEFEGVAGVDDDGNGYIDDIYGIDTWADDTDPFDELGHGTHIAGIIGATGDNGIGVTGINQKVRILNCRFAGPWGFGTLSGALECLEYVKALKGRGENIVATNHSWGGAGNSALLREVVDAQRDILFVAAAGNYGNDNDLFPRYPASLNLPNVIAVASTDHNDELATTSNYGRRSVHLGAPGVNIFSTLPEHTHWGASRYGQLSGTSMAVPHVAGVAALLAAAKPSLNWFEIRNLLFSGGDPVDALSATTISGRRVSGAGSIECRKKRVFSATAFPEVLVPGEPVFLEALSIQCDMAKGPVFVETDGGERVKLRDDGVYPDLVRKDGLFAAEWTPGSISQELLFRSGPYKDAVVFPAEPF